MKHNNLIEKSPNIMPEPFADYQIEADLQEASFTGEPPFLQVLPTLTKSEKLAIGLDILNRFTPNYKKNLPAPPKHKPKPAIWIAPGESVEIHGLVIEGGMLYIGDYLPSLNPYEHSRSDWALLDPRLPIDHTPDAEQDLMIGSMSTYSSISPRTRYAYLNWLATGKKLSASSCRYVLIYFYGLERRLLHDINGDPSLAAESLAIEAEIERLLDLSADSHLFISRATALLSYVRNDKYKKIPLYYTKSAPAPTYHEGLSQELKLGIAQISRDKIPLPADWAFSWYLSAPNPPFYARTAAIRCPNEFKQLFIEEYTAAFDAGLIIKPNKTKLTSTYHPVNRSLYFMNYEKNSDLPNILRLHSPLKKLAPLIEVCHKKLDRYSRFIGRCPEKQATLDALLELPAPLWPDPVKQVLQQLKIQLHAANSPLELNFTDLIDKLPPWERPSKAKMILFLDLLDNHYQIGLEPDCRYDGKFPAKNTRIVLFPLEQSLSTTDLFQPDYLLGALIIKLSTFTLQATGFLPQKKLARLMCQIDTWVWLNPSIRLRLKAQTLWLSNQTIKLTGLKKYLPNLTVPQRELLASSIVQIAQADGKVSVSEIKNLEQIFKLLEIDAALLYRTLNQATTDAPLTILPKAATQLDMGKVALLQAESAKVASLLDEIFAETDTTAKSLLPPQAPTALWGLSLDLADFVVMLAKKSNWGQSELQQLATKHGIMLDGALEQINDAAFDHFDEAFIEADAVGFEINQDIVKVINQ